jgi:hypothetical protein
MFSGNNLRFFSKTETEYMYLGYYFNFPPSTYIHQLCKMETSFQLPEQDEEIRIDDALYAAAMNSVSLQNGQKRTTAKRANKAWEISSSSDEEELPIRPTRVSFSDQSTIAAYDIDTGAILEQEMTNAFPFPVGTNPDVQTCCYGMDVMEYNPGFQKPRTTKRLDVAAVLKNEPTVIVAHFIGTPHPTEIDVGFKVGFMVATPTSACDDVCLVVWHADNQQITVFNLAGQPTQTGMLPTLPIGWIWSYAVFRTPDCLSLEIYNPANKTYQAVDCEMAHIA